jgi:hypothetical protein
MRHFRLHRSCRCSACADVGGGAGAGGGFIMGFEGGLSEYDPDSGRLRRLAPFEEGLATRPNDG